MATRSSLLQGGGALVTKSAEDKQKAVFLATQARDEAPHYQHSHIGYNYRMSNICAGIGRGQMEVLKEHVNARRAMHNFYRELFQGVAGVKIYSEPDDTFFCNHWLTVIQIVEAEANGSNCETLRLHLQKENIESRPLWKPMHLQPIFEDAPYYGMGVASKAFEECLCLPSGSNLGEIEKERIASAINEYLNRD